MDEGSFRSAQDQGYVRATAMMNSKSSNEIRWSVRLTSGGWIGLGIASNELIQNEQPGYIDSNDKNSIIYYPYAGLVRKGGALIQHMSTYSKSGDEIHFRFQPKMKKILILFVSQLF